MKVKESTPLSHVDKQKKAMPQSKGVLFSWNLAHDRSNDSLMEAEVFLYRACDIFDDRFQSLEESQNEDNTMRFKLGLAQKWTYAYRDDGIINASQCKEASMMKRVLLKQGTYVYLYRINGLLQVNKGDMITTLATKRTVNYVDVRLDEEIPPYQDINTDACEDARARQCDQINQVNRTSELFKAYASVKGMYQVNISVHRVSPLERSIWNRVEKEMAARFQFKAD